MQENIIELITKISVVICSIEEQLQKVKNDFRAILEIIECEYTESD